MVAIGLCFVAYALSEIAMAIQGTTFIVKLPDTINVNTVNHIKNIATRALAEGEEK